MTPDLPDGTSKVPEAAELRDAVLTLLSVRDPDTSICPSEVARRVGGDDWRPLMGPIREVAAGLADDGAVEVTQRGQRVDVRSTRGPVRLRRGPRWPVQEAGEGQGA